MRFVLTTMVLACSTAALPASDPPPVAPPLVPDPPPVVARTEFEALKARVAFLEGRKAASPACGCSAVKCPTTGFCGGAGCACTQAKLRTVPPLAPEVAAPLPFDLSGCPGGRCTTPTTPVIGAAESLPYGLTDWAGAGTPIGARAGTSGITSGCANGACAAPARGLFRRR